MKKINKLILLLLSFIMCFGLGVKDVNAEEMSCIQSSSANKLLIINGESIELFNLYGATFVPFEPVAKYCNITLNKSGDKKYYFNKDGNNYIVNIGESGNMKNGEMLYNLYEMFNSFGYYIGSTADKISNEYTKIEPQRLAKNFEENGFLYVSLEFLYKELKVPFRIGMTGGAIILGNEYNAQGTINEMEHEYSIVIDKTINNTLNVQYNTLSKDDGNWEQNENHNWIFRKNDGKKATGWNKIGEYFYYLDSDGVMQMQKQVDGYKLGCDGAVVFN
ncbi:hypothetical protein GND98_014280 [Clostridium butyricum]|jgi:hypothetical protein|uniref:Cell wall-binding protein n=1 Tax=Clostridium butyricum TaxID=1492 RepID=A0A6L9ESY2_CLOBU|nr:hypothetical protein [Clostridium butyricum]